MAGFILRFLFAVGGLWAASHFVPGVSYSGTGSLLFAALVLGIVNALVRPVLVLLTLPLTIVTLGLFLLVINALMLWLTSAFIRGFHVHGFAAAFWGALVVSVVSWIGAQVAEK